MYGRGPTSESGVPAYSKRQYSQSDVTPTQDSSVRHVAEVVDRQEFFSTTIGLLMIGPSSVGTTLPVESNPLSKIAVTPPPSGFYQAMFTPVTPVLTPADTGLQLARPLSNFVGGNTIAAGEPALTSGNALVAVYPWQWLQSLAQNYEEWQIKSLLIEWVPLTPYSTLGQIVLAYTPDATAVPEDFNTYQAMMSTGVGVSGSIWAAIKLDIPFNATNMPDGWKTVQSQVDSANVQSTQISGAARGGLQQFFAGYFMVAFEGISSSIATSLPIPVPVSPATTVTSPNVFLPLGSLKATYSICLRAPVFMSNPLVTSTQLNTLVSHFGTTSAIPTAPFGRTAHPYTDGGANVVMSPYPGALGTSQTFCLPANRYLVSFMLTGTGITSLTLSAAALNNGITIVSGPFTSIQTASLLIGYAVVTSTYDYSAGSMLANLLQFDAVATTIATSELFFHVVASIQA